MIKLIIFFLLIFNFSYAAEFMGDFKQGSFILGKKTSLCGFRYRNKVVLPHLGAPAMIKFGTFIFYYNW